MNEHIDFIQREVSRGATLRADAQDTVYKAYALLGRIPSAKDAAQELIDKCLTHDDAGMTDGSRLSLLRSAYSFLKTGTIADLQ